MPCIRQPRGVRVFKDGVFVREFGGVNETVDFLMPHSRGKLKWISVRSMLSVAMRNNTPLFGFTFERKPYVYSKQLVAINPITGDYVIKHSVGEMGRFIFGPSDYRASRKISELCRNRKIHGGFMFKYLGNDYVECGGPGCNVRKPVLQINMLTGEVINFFPSVAHCAKFIFKLGCSGSSVDEIRMCISLCCTGGRQDPKTYLGFKWRFVEPNEPAENMPLPPPNDEGL